MRIHWSLKGQNRGASLIAVLVTIMFVSMIGIVISQITITNIQMKEMEQRGKTNFYDAEKILDNLSAGLNTQAATSMQKAYQEVLSKYRTVTSTGGDIQESFSRKYIKFMIDYFGITTEGGAAKEKKNDDGVVTYQAGYYSLSKVRDAFTEDDYRDKLITVPTVGTDSVGWYLADYEAGTFILKGIKIKSENTTTKYSTTIQTDFVFSVPPLDFEASYNVKEFMRYSLIANDGINVSSPLVTVRGNVYAGADGIYTKSSSVHDSKFLGKTIITRGDIMASDGKFQVGNGDSNIWVENIRTLGGVGTELTLNGNIFVADDLEMDGKKGTVYLKGYYYGYNFQKTYETDALAQSAAYSSTIALNGRDSRLDMTGLNQLMLAGRTYLRRKVGNIDMGQVDVPLGESLSVRSNQMAYYVPDTFLDITEETKNAPVFTDETGASISNLFGIGDIYDYVSPTNPVLAFHYIKNVNTNVNNGIAYYLKFCSKTLEDGTVISAEQNANNFFSEYYNSNKTLINTYAEYYVANDGIVLPTKEDGTIKTILTLKGDILYRTEARADGAASNLKVGRIEIGSTNLDTTDFRNYAGRLAIKYKSLQSYLEDNHKGITAADVRFTDDNKAIPGETLLDNLLAPASDQEHYTYALQEYLKDSTENPKKVELRYNASGVRDDHGEYAVILVDNGPNKKLDASDTGTGVFPLDQSIKGGIVIATGDVRLDTAASEEDPDIILPNEFTGVVISGGTISFSGNSSINSNELLVSQLFTNDLRKSSREFTQLFKGYEVVSDAEMGIVKIDRYLTYDNWTKTID